MTADLRVVCDTNVIISAMLLPLSVPRQAINRALREGRLLISAATTAELDEVIRRPRFDKYVSEEERIEFLTALVHEAELVNVVETVTDCRDPRNNKFLELAVSGRATHIVTGDSDLLAIHPFRGISVVSPSSFLTLA
ncbi:MAG: putative toxin-antitoxin system toxin component, PIN family [Planctomycetes bacterium]|nr:putative toxin-antitoxin system toxin component, PIN family [Planctomycetota bacterium]